MSDGYREKCTAAKGDKCEICGDSPVVVHHIDGDRSNDSLDNLVPVCDSCHKSIHWCSDGYEDWYERLRPGSQWADAEPGQNSSITLNAVLANRLRDMKPPGASWDTFFLDLLEQVQGEQTVALRDEDVQAIAEQVADGGVEISDNSRDAISDVVADRVVDSLRSLRR